MRASEPTEGAAAPEGGPGRDVAADEAVTAFVADALSDATPRSATLALLRFDEYLGLLRRSGLEVSPNGALARALRTGLIRVCRADGAPRPRGRLPSGTDRG